jgi:RimJ/RimL family protein N-acetyltransferase
MLRGDKVGLRARHEADIPVLHAELYEDVTTWSKADFRPWRPLSPESMESVYRAGDAGDQIARFSVVELSGSALAGEAALWGIDPHQRMAHLGLSLRPAFRGRGLGTDIVRVLCGYGFMVRGMHRLQIETLSENEAMIRAAIRVGFVREGTLRRSVWVNGVFVDEAILGMLADEWRKG